WEEHEQTFSPQLGDPQTVKFIVASKFNSSASIQSFPGGVSPKNDTLPDPTVMSKCTSILSSTEKINNGTMLSHTSCLCHQSETPSIETAVGMHNVEVTNVRDSVASNTLDDHENASCLISQDKITAEDALCCYCKELIYRPIVLNCGHAFCESCTNIFEDRAIICQVCQSLHPGDRPGVCLELHQFLEHSFTIKYAERKMSVLVNNKMHQHPKEESPI
ncbi:hypothetical protein KI387_002206, partial [Taxus chinensis]